jgi:peptidoglycan/xylan/chitin deacetylase (PgdA/CDA1 family)
MKKIQLRLFLVVFVLFGCKSISRSAPDFDLITPIVIFCFDDGPNIHADTTARLLDVLKKFEVRAMFALLGERAEAHPELVRRIYNEGHYIINHGYSDKWVYSMGKDKFLDNLIGGETAIFSALGKELHPKLYRPHGGFYNSRQERIWREEGYSLVHCNIRVYDAVMSEKNRDKLVNQVIRNTVRQGGGVILLHDARDSHSRTEKELARNPNGSFNRSWIPDAVEEIITELLAKGFTIGSPALVIPDNF